MNMARKESAGGYQIGIYAVRRDRCTKPGHKWVAETGALGFRREFKTLADAHLELTGEEMHDN